MLRHPSRGNLEHRGRQQQSVGDDHQQFGPPVAQRGEIRVALELRSVAPRGSPRASARCLTALARSARPRPAGRSGCVSTPTRRGADAASASSAGSANSGVPANAIRSASMEMYRP